MDIINYTISYTLNNGTLDNRVTSYNVESETITLPTPVKDGYEFMGWYYGDTEIWDMTVTEDIVVQARCSKMRSIYSLLMSTARKNLL